MTTKKEQKAAEVAANKYAAYAKKVRALAGWVSGRILNSDISHAYDNGMTAEGCAVLYACQTAVGAAVWPQKIAAVESAAKHAREDINRMVKTLEAADWCIDTVAPYPTRTDPEYLHRVKVITRNTYMSLFKTKSEYKGRDLIYYASRDAEREARYITSEEESAAFQYNLFVCKMVNKIGDGAKSATLSGNHVWSYSFLTVTMDDGRIDVWKTQQIENRSKLGLWFPQWPSRIIKPKKKGG